MTECYDNFVKEKLLCARRSNCQFDRFAHNSFWNWHAVSNLAWRIGLRFKPSFLQIKSM